MNKDITPYNEKNRRHGLWETYYLNYNLSYKCFYQNDKLVGYEEIYLYLSKSNKKKYHI